MFKGTDLDTFHASDLNNLNHGQSMFEGTPIKEFTNTTNNLLFGNQMFKDCEYLTTFTGKLGSLENGTEMFSGTTSLKLFSCGDMNELEIANNMFTNSGIVAFISNMPKLTDTTDMFKGCGSLHSFKGNLNSIISHKNMFSGCSSLKHFSGDLTSLEYGTSMFETAPDLSTFETKTLKNLKYGERMFYGSSLSSFDVEKEDTENAEVQAMNLSSLTNAKGMFTYCTNLTELEKADLSELTDATQMFEYSGLAEWNNDMPNLMKARRMFAYAKDLETFTGDIRNLKVAEQMFRSTKLRQFIGDMSKVTNSTDDGGNNGCGIFNVCKELVTVKTNLPLMVSGAGMFFGCEKLKTFECHSMKSAKSTDRMFANCYSFSSFNTELEEVENGFGMFWGAPLTSFYAGPNGLRKLTNGGRMFNNCKLDAESVAYILDGISEFTGTHASSVNPDVPETFIGRLNLGIQPSAVDAVLSRIEGSEIVQKGKHADIVVNG